MISDDSQRALDIVMFVVAIIFSGIRIGLLFDLRRRSCHVTLAQYWGALLLLLASVMSIVVGVLDIVDMKNFLAKGNSVVGPEKLPYRMSKEPEQVRSSYRLWIMAKSYDRTIGYRQHYKLQRSFV
jgi:hypothetical protein